MSKSYCFIHKSGGHSIENCFSYRRKTAEEKVACIKELSLCFVCLSTGHRLVDCPSKRKCGTENCERLHHKSLHEAHSAGLIFHSVVEDETDLCLLQIMKVDTSKTGVSVNVLWDGGATNSLITFSKANQLIYNKSRWGSRYYQLHCISPTLEG